jgi:hypothetical protein
MAAAGAAVMAVGGVDKIGQSGNAKVNTTHQGHQQDR